jgi:hypothetical protein
MNTKKASDFIIQKMRKEKNYLGRLKKMGKHLKRISRIKSKKKQQRNQKIFINRY